MIYINTIGYITRDIELKTGNGTNYVNFGIGVNEGYGDNKKTTYFSCTVFGYEAERLHKAGAKKGRQIFVNGKFGTSEFQRVNSNEKGHSLNITVTSWNYVPGTNNQKDKNDSDNTDVSKTVQNDANHSGKEYPEMNLDDEGLPF